MPSRRLQTSIALHRAARLDEAEAGYRECLREGEHEAVMPLAALLLQSARHQDAVALLEPLARSSPERVDVAVNLSVALRNCGRLEEALEVARRASSRAPEQLTAWNAHGLAALELDRAEEARAAFENGLRIAPGHLALTLHHAHALRRLGRNAEAMAAYESVVEADPALVEGWRGLAQVQAALGDVDAALRCRTRARQLAPRDREIALEHAVALLHAGRVREAVQGLQQATHANVDDAQAWAWLGRAQLRQGDLAQAQTSFERAHALDPHDATIAHLHAASTGSMPGEVESEYIRRLFDDFADRFEDTLVGHLAYDTPRRMRDFLRGHGADAAASVLDLGCGTGLMAQQLARPGRFVDGVDLSPRMLAHARAKRIYRELHEAEVGAFLRDATAQWELVVAVDVLNYLPDLRPLFAAAWSRITPAGSFAFSIERAGGDGTELLAVTARYRHAVAQVVAELRDAGFVDIVHEDVVLRMESGQPVAGALMLARRT
jgi:predicted TPR repeat methyltransferase